MDMALRVAGVIFLLVGIMHLLRLVFKVSVIVAGFTVPLWFSVLGVIFPLSLSLWMFKSVK